MKRRNIALIGFRTTGKSVTGKILAKRLGRIFVDMDDVLVATLGQDIDGWVRSHGWESFRKAESELLKTLSLRENLVVATGGGVILKGDNRQILKESFDVVWLQAPPHTLYSRLLEDPKTRSQRPALTDLPMKEEIERLLHERSPLYSQAADLILDTDTCPPQEVASQIHEWSLGQGCGVGTDCIVPTLVGSS